MAIENLRRVGDTLYEQRKDGVLYPISRMASEARREPDTGSRTGFPEIDRMLVDLGNVNQALNPVEAIGQSMGASRRMMAPETAGWDRVAALGDMLSGVGGVVAPVAAAGRLGKPAATALMESLLGGSSLPDPRNEAEAIAKNILEMRATGNVDAVTESMMNAADPQYMYNYTPLPMDQASRMERARERGALEEYHGTTTGSDMLYPSSNRGSGNRKSIGFVTSSDPYVSSSYADPNFGSVFPMMNEPPKSGFSVVQTNGDLWSNIPGQTPVTLPSGRETSVASYASMPDNFYGDLSGNFRTDHVSRGAFIEGDGGVKFNSIVDRGIHGPRLKDDPSVMREFQQKSSEPSSVMFRHDTRGMRSRFARFDPMFAHLRNLSAGVAAGAVGLEASQYDPEHVDRLAESVRKREFAKGGHVQYDPAAIDSIINQIREVNHG